MNDQDLLDGLTSLATQLRQWTEQKNIVEHERTVDDRPKTEDWRQQSDRNTRWFESIRVMLERYQKDTARRLGIKPSPYWTPEEMIIMLTERTLK
jgi:hypothetical protein